MSDSAVTVSMFFANMLHRQELSLSSAACSTGRYPSSDNLESSPKSSGVSYLDLQS